LQIDHPLDIEIIKFILINVLQGGAKFPTGGNSTRFDQPASACLCTRSADLVRFQSRRLESGWKKS